ncbi:hypothetical protein BN11_2760002 [Nostocoides australiense Ben110]|uniref:Uncharacterized protein n=1 Tax=Nostocoides australiense Ben110 TaxID=1193182 RepID=W6JXT5_9MICO|nr:hypothetical protein BN11_2760002 [Tetrasphaera australiensis Ben110]
MLKWTCNIIGHVWRAYDGPGAKCRRCGKEDATKTPK